MSMTSERVYAALLRLYPRRFREAYAREMLDTFREFRRHYPDHAARFWTLALADLGRSVWQERLDDLSGRFTIRWTLACAVGAVTTGALGSAMSGAFSYFYHPYFEGLIVPVWAYGALLGLGFGLTQSIGLRDRAALGTWWVLITAVSAGLGLEIAVLVASAGGPVAYGAVLGGWVAGGQWLVLRNEIGRAGWRVMSSAVALAVGVLSCGIALNSTLRGMNPLTSDALAIIAAGGQEPGFQVMRRGLYAPMGWTELTVELGVLATTGLVIGMLTARPLSLALTHVDVE